MPSRRNPRPAARRRRGAAESFGVLGPCVARPQAEDAEQRVARARAAVPRRRRPRRAADGIGGVGGDRPLLVRGGKRLLFERRELRPGGGRRRAVGRVGPPRAGVRRRFRRGERPVERVSVRPHSILRQPRQRRRRPPARAHAARAREVPRSPHRHLRFARRTSTTRSSISVTFSRRSGSRPRWRARRQRTQWWTPVAIARRARVFAANDASDPASLSVRTSGGSSANSWRACAAPNLKKIIERPRA